MDFLYYTIALLFSLAVTAAAVWAFRWALRSGQMQNLEAGAAEIFDSEEPVGRPQETTFGRK